MPSVPAVQLLLPTNQEKRCPKCGETKPLDAFALALRRKGQRAGWCKACMAACGRQAQRNPAARERHRRETAEYMARKKAGEPPKPRKITAQVYVPPPEKMPIPRHLYQRRRWLRLNYGLTMEAYEALWQAQCGVCAICKRPETRKHPKGGEWLLSVDHCHATGKVRALLCDRCNIGLGSFHDDPATLEQAAAYIREHRN